MTKFTNIQIDGKGKVFLQVEDADAEWGFYLTDGRNVWDGGFGIADNRSLVPTKRSSGVTRQAQHAIENGYGYPVFSRHRFVDESIRNA